MSGQHQSSGDKLVDVCDGELYRSHPMFQESEHALQIIAYYDEMTLTNSLMSRATKYKIIGMCQVVLEYMCIHVHTCTLYMS